MKKALVILLALMTSGFAACTGTDDDTTVVIDSAG
jgi:hypothetical protein